LQQKEISIFSSIEEKTEVYADINSLNIIFSNLLKNAIKFSHPKGRIFINTTRTYDEISISISDNGIGIPKAQLKKLFTADRHPMAKEIEKRSGLGLLICKKYLELNNGTIIIESQEGEGTVATITLPIPSPV